MLYLYKYLFNVSYQLFSKPGIQGHIHAKEYNWFNIVFLPSWELLFCKGSLTGIFFFTWICFFAIWKSLLWWTLHTIHTAILYVQHIAILYIQLTHCYTVCITFRVYPWNICRTLVPETRELFTYTYHTLTHPVFCKCAILWTAFGLKIPPLI